MFHRGQSVGVILGTLLCASLAAAGMRLAAVQPRSGHAAQSGAALTPAQVQALLARIQFCGDTHELEGAALEADESWTPTRSGEDGGPVNRETDRVEYYHGVPIEIQQTENGKALSPSELRKAQRLADQTRRNLDRVWRGPGDNGRLLLIYQDVWRISQIIAEYDWSGHEGPVMSGDPTAYLTYVPDPARRSHSREEHILLSITGEVQVDTASGQVLGGNFRSIHPVNFGAGILARFDAFDGTFTMQPYGSAWVMHTLDARLRCRELLHFMNGVESITYHVPAAMAAPAGSNPAGAHGG